MRVVSFDYIRQHQYYSELADLAECFNHAIIEDDAGTLRFKPNMLVVGLYHEKGMEAIFDDFEQGGCTVEELIKFYMSIGYALGGFEELFDKEASAFITFSDKDGSAVADLKQVAVDRTIVEYLVAKYRKEHLYI